MQSAHGAAQNKDAKSLRHGHFGPPIVKIFGNSSISRSLNFIFFAPVALLKLKSSDATSLPVFQSRTATLDRGPSSTSLDVLTYRHG